MNIDTHCCDFEYEQKRRSTICSSGNTIEMILSGKYVSI